MLGIKLGGIMAMNRKSLSRKIMHGTVLCIPAAIIAACMVFLGLDTLYPLDRHCLYRPPAQRIYDREHRLIQLRLSPDGYWRFPARDTEIPQLFKQAVLCFEDRYFYFHPGVNPFSLVRAAWHNLFSDRLVGGSTITMQVARMMHQKPRTLGNKLREILMALQLEYHFSKPEILERYLNLAPYGGNIEGIGAAAYFYFRKQPTELSISEIAILTTIPKNPNHNRPDRASQPKIMRKRVIDALSAAGVINTEQARRALREPISGRRHPAPLRAPHFTSVVARRNTSAPIIETDYNLPLHTFARQCLQRRVEQLRQHRVHNAAAVIIYNPDMTVRAYVGSQDFHNQQHGGQNDGAAMPHSPGSALKPFIYARALDAGLITPKQKLFDVPFHIADYSPKNFDDRFFGIVSAREALQASLNIPAIELNLLLGEQSLYEMLKLAGIRSIHQPKVYYGAGIAVGTAALSLLDLTHLYTAFANGGNLLPLDFEGAGRTSAAGISLFSPQAAFLVSEILADGFRKDLSAYWESGARIPKIAFKTGTSAQSRDLLTIAYNREFTIGVWLGNVNGQFTDQLTGIDAVSDVVFDIFRYLEHRHVFTWFHPPGGLKRTEICTDPVFRTSGCRSYEMDWVIENTTPRSPCTFLRAEVIAYLMESGRLENMDALRFHPCYTQFTDNKPRIVAPNDQATLTLDRRQPKVFQKIRIKCYSFQTDPEIHWFIDQKRPLASRSGQEHFIALLPGPHHIVCLDSNANSSRSRIVIKKE